MRKVVVVTAVVKGRGRRSERREVVDARILREEGRTPGGQEK